MTQVTATLAEFLLARIAEDEERARALAAAYERDEVRPPGRLVNLFALVVPSSVLAECEAKRRIVALHHAALDAYTVIGSDFEQGQVYVADATLRLLALPYASHPDYREEWRP